jgi:hypothetical protein
VGEQAEGELMWLEEEYEAAIQHLRALVANGCYHDANYCDAGPSCIYCKKYLDDSDSPHRPDCPYDAAEQFLDSLNAPQAPQT